MTIDELDLLYERIGSNEYRCGEWPDLEQLRAKVKDNPKEHIEYLIWVLETSKSPTNPREKEVKNYINRLLIKTINVID